MSFDDISYNNLSQVEAARKSMLREQWIRVYELRVTHEALRKCRQYHQEDASRNCKSLVLKYMKMLETYQYKVIWDTKRTIHLNRYNIIYNNQYYYY